MAPVLAFGPNLCAGIALAGLAPFAFSVVRSMVPSGNLGFFLGPGRPRSRGGAFGSMEGGARFRPLAVAPPLFFLPSTLGGASELLSTTSLPCGTGVAFESDDLSATSGSCTDGDASFLMDGSADVSPAGELCDDDHCASRVGEMRSDTIRLFLPGFAADLSVADMVVEVGGGVLAVVLTVWWVLGSVAGGIAARAGWRFR